MRMIRMVERGARGYVVVGQTSEGCIESYFMDDVGQVLLTKKAATEFAELIRTMPKGQRVPYTYTHVCVAKVISQA